jgi:hypothetical protein
MVVDAADIREITDVRGWLRPALDIGLRSGHEHRITAHPWWRRQLARLGRDLDNIGQEPAASV